MKSVIPRARMGYRYVEVARRQPEYLPLHTIQSSTNCRCEWELSWRERIALLFGGRLTVMFLTWNRPMYPLKLFVFDSDDPDKPLDDGGAQ